jgi:two-component system, sensor histidine kinase
MRTMEQADFARTVKQISERVLALRSIARGGGREAGSVAEEAVEELATCLEGLSVAEEELRRQSAELALMHARAETERRRYLDLFWTAPHGYLTSDLRGVIGEGNRAAGALLGLAPVYLTGKPLGSFVAPADRMRFADWLRRLAGGGDGGEDGEPEAELALRSLSDGREFPCTVRVSRLVGRGDRRELLRWSLVDQSDRDAARDGARMQRDALRKDEFVAMLGHELRNPLAAIALAAEMLHGELGDEAGRLPTPRSDRSLAIIDRHVGQLRRLVDDLLDASRLAHGKIGLHLAEIDLAPLVREVVDDVRPRVAARGLELTTELPDAPLVAWCDAERIRQVLGNLLDNALKYTPPGGHIVVGLSSAGDAQAILTVRDDGLGMTRETIERAFGLFEQAAGADRPSESGLGLGLSLVRQLVELHGGRVEARSEGLGAGSELVVTLPRGRDGEHRARLSDDEDAESLRVLVVDDDPDLAEMLGITLERFGHRVASVEEGAAAIEQAAAIDAEIAIVDLGMPGMNGYEVARQLRRVRPGIILVALTGFGDQRHRSDAQRAGFDHYLLKPVDVVGLDRMLRKLHQGRLTR